MVFGQILKNVLDKNQEVWIPTIGLLCYNKSTSKLGLDTYGSGSDKDLISLIQEIHQVSEGEAKGILIQEVEALKSTIQSVGKYIVEGLGEISLSNGIYQFESKKPLFPTNFFGAGNFNTDSFKDNAPTEEELQAKISAEKKKVKESIPVVEEKNEPQPLAKEEISSPKKEEPKVEAETAPKDLFTTPPPPPVTPSTPEPEIEEVVIEEVEEPILNIEKEEVQESSFEIESDNSYSPTSEEIYEEEIILEPEPEPELLVIDEPRRNIGHARYDEGFYNYDLTVPTESNKKKWGVVAGLSLSFLALGFLTAWLFASFKGEELLGLNPLWSSKKEVKKVEKFEKTVAVIADTAAIDSSEILASILTDTLTNPKVLAANTEDKNTVDNTSSETSKTEISAKKSSTSTIAKSTQTNTSTTSAKKASTSTINKPDTKRATSSKTLNANKAIVSSNSESMDSAAKRIATLRNKNEKVIGRPYATANYTKGNHYLSFGKFKVPSAAKKLRRDIKTKAGIETDIILLDGTYRVVIPFLSKEKAEAASRDYVSTTLFE